MKKSIAIILSIMLVLAITFPAAALSSIAVKSIKLNKTKITLKVGQTSNLTVTFTPANTTQKKLTYATGNKKIATVTTTGKITGVSKGFTTITVYTLNKKIFAKCNVTISQLASVPTETLKENIEFSIMMYGSWYKEGFQAIENLMAEKKIGAKFSVDKIPEGEQGDQVAKARFAAGEMPDFAFMYNAAWVKSSIGGMKNVVEIDGEWTKNFDEKTLKSISYSIDGKVVGLPIGGVHIGGMLYNKKVFSDLGLSVPNNWNELLAACKKIKAAGKIPVYYSGKDSWTLQLIPVIGFSREFKSKDMNELSAQINTNKAKYTEQKLFIDALAKTKELKDMGYVQKTYLSDMYDGAQKALAEGEAAMYPMATWVMDEIKKKYPDKLNDIGAFAVPFDGNDTAPAWLPSAVFVTGGCKNVDLAKKVINFMGSAEAQQAYFKAQPGVPFCKGVKADLYPAQQDLYDIFTTDGRGGPIFQLNLVHLAGDFAKMSQELVVGSKTPEQIAKVMDEETLKNAKAKNDPNFK